MKSLTHFCIIMSRKDIEVFCKKGEGKHDIAYFLKASLLKATR